MPIIIRDQGIVLTAAERDAIRQKLMEEVKQRSYAEYGKVYTGDPYVIFQKIFD